MPLNAKNKDGNIIINDNLDAKFGINFSTSSMDSNVAKNSLDTNIYELLGALPPPPPLPTTMSRKEWEIICSESLDVLGYPNAVTASGLKVVPWDVYYNTYNYNLRLRRAISQSATRLEKNTNAFFSTFSSSKQLFNDVIFPQHAGSYSVFSTERSNFGILSLQLNSIKNTTQEFLNLVSLNAETQSASGLASQPNPPTLTYPVDGAQVNVGRPQFSWTSTDWSIRWALSISLDANFNNIYYAKDFSNNTVTIDRNLNRGTMYYWQVKAYNELDVESLYSAPRMFTVADTAIITTEQTTRVVSQFQTTGGGFNNIFSLSWEPSSRNETKWRVLYTRDGADTLAQFAATNTSVKATDSGLVKIAIVDVKTDVLISWYEDAKYAHGENYIMYAMVQPMLSDQIDTLYQSDVVSHVMSNGQTVSLPSYEPLRTDSVIVAGVTPKQPSKFVVSIYGTNGTDLLISPSNSFQSSDRNINFVWSSSAAIIDSEMKARLAVYDKNKSSANWIGFTGVGGSVNTTKWQNLIQQDSQESKRSSSYILQVAYDSAFNNIAWEDTIVPSDFKATQITKQLTLDPNVTYYWRVLYNLVIYQRWGLFSTVDYATKTVTTQMPSGFKGAIDAVNAGGGVLGYDYQDTRVQDLKLDSGNRMFSTQTQAVTSSVVTDPEAEAAAKAEAARRLEEERARLAAQARNKQKGIE